jgi:hypothetical protein
MKGTVRGAFSIDRTGWCKLCGMGSQTSASDLH